MLLGAEVMSEVAQGVFALAMAVVAAWVTIRTKRNEQQIRALKRSQARCRRRYARLYKKFLKVRRELAKRPLDKKTPRR